VTKTETEITKYHFVGCVDYAQHNFARLKPLLYSETGRHWDGLAERAWFPNEGLVFTVQGDLKYAQTGSLWLFRLGRNPRGDAIEKDVFSALQVKPAVELMIGMAPLDIEALRRFVCEEGFVGSPTGKSGAAVSELNDRWVVIPEIQRDEQGRGRPTPTLNLKHLKVLVGTPEEVCGIATPGGQFVLPPIPSASGETRNWLPPAQFLDTLAADLKRWAPHGPQRAKASAAANALRELAPQMAGLSALKAEDAKVAMARATNLTEAAETITGAAETILGLIVDQEPFKAEIERRRAEINVELETEALAAVEQKEGAARDRLLAEQASLRAEIGAGNARLETLRAEILALEAEAQTARSARSENVEALDAQVDALVQRAATEPAKMLADWIGVSGFVVGGMGGEQEPHPRVDANEPPPAPEAPNQDPTTSRPLAKEDLGPLLFTASPATNPGSPRLLIIDAALRARELPVLVGPFAREFAESWLSVAGGPAPVTVLTDPTLLSLMDLTPGGARGDKAPLREAFARAAATEEPVIVLLDDLDPAAASFWLPELARAQRHPRRYGFPPNLLFLAVVEADPSQMSLTRLRAGELFPLAFDDCDPNDAAPDTPASPFSLTSALVVAPTASTSWPARVEAFEASLKFTFKSEDAKSLAAGLAAFLQYCKGGGATPGAETPLAGLLSKAANDFANGGARGN
jgi:hypothetical protein